MVFLRNLLFVPKPVSESEQCRTGSQVRARAAGQCTKHRCAGLWALSRDIPRDSSATGPQLGPDRREQKVPQPRRGRAESRGVHRNGDPGVPQPRGHRAPTRPKGRPRRTACPQPGFLREAAPVPTRKGVDPRRAAGGAARPPAPPRPLAAAVQTHRGAGPPARGPRTRAATGHAPTRPAPRRQPITRCESSARAGPKSGLSHWWNRASLTACPAPPLTSAVGGGSGPLQTPLRGPNRQRRTGWPGAPPGLGPLSSPWSPAASPPSGHRAPGPSRGGRENGRGQRACVQRREAE